MRHSPSISPADRLDRDMYLVLEDFSSGAAWRETDEDRTDYRTLISDLLTGQYDHPLRVVAFNPLEGWSRDASEDVAHELEQRARGDRAGAGVHRTLHWPANWRATVAATARVLRLAFRPISAKNLGACWGWRAWSPNAGRGRRPRNPARIVALSMPTPSLDILRNRKMSVAGNAYRP